ncbi:RTC4-like domain-containing protein [Xylaria venustula]|nr:RTC4-like domain-containing protein [Xylaria venustula]
MTEKRPLIFQKRIGSSTGSAPLTNGQHIRSAKRQKFGDSSGNMKGNTDPMHDPITAPPESSDDEAENIPVNHTTGKDSDESDESYNRRKAADICATTFDNKTSRLRAGRDGGKSRESKTEKPSSFTRSKRPVEIHQANVTNQLERELEAPREKRKRVVTKTKYGQQPTTKTQSSLRATSSASRNSRTPSSSQDNAQSTSAERSFKLTKSISPLKSQSPQKIFKNKRQISELDELEGSKPSFKRVPRHESSPLSTPRKFRARPASEVANDKDEIADHPTTKGLRNRSEQRKTRKRDKTAPEPIPEERPERPVFKMPGMEDLDSFDDDSGSIDATAPSMDSQHIDWDHSEVEDNENTTATPKCPMCHQEVDRELLEKHSTRGKMSVKQQTAFCRLHKRQSAAKAGTDKGYPKIDWETLDNRFSSHKDFLLKILEGTQTSHYRKILREKVESGKNRTLLTSHDNLTPGYYGPRGLQAMTQFIMSTLSDVIRRRAVEDKLISARTYTGYVQTVLVPELTVRLIMEDMPVSEERAREVLEESVEIGELLHEEARDVVNVNEMEEDLSLLV